MTTKRDETNGSNLEYMPARLNINQSKLCMPVVIATLLKKYKCYQIKMITHMCNVSRCEINNRKDYTFTLLANILGTELLKYLTLGR